MLSCCTGVSDILAMTCRSHTGPPARALMHKDPPRRVLAPVYAMSQQQPAVVLWPLHHGRWEVKARKRPPLPASWLANCSLNARRYAPAWPIL